MKTLALKEARFLHNLKVPVILAFIFLGVRMYITGTLHYGFLLWNLFLASIPLLLSYVVSYTKWWQNRLVYLGLFCLWLLFLPNAPYIVTDFIHLEGWSQMPLWFDFLLIGLFAWSGLLMAFKSTYLIYESLKWYCTPQTCKQLIIICGILCGFGVYLGRFVRLNSWDILGKPASLISLTLKSLINPSAWLFSFGFGLFLITAYSLYLKFSRAT